MSLYTSLIVARRDDTISPDGRLFVRQHPALVRQHFAVAGRAVPAHIQARTVLAGAHAHHLLEIAVEGGRRGHTHRLGDGEHWLVGVRQQDASLINAGGDNELQGRGVHAGEEKATEVGLAQVAQGGQGLGVAGLHVVIQDVLQRGFEGEDLRGLGDLLGGGGEISGQLRVDGQGIHPQQLGGFSLGVERLLKHALHEEGDARGGGSGAEFEVSAGPVHRF